LKETEDLNKVYEEAIAYIKSRGFKLFPGTLLLSEGVLGRVIWSSGSDDWKSFFEIAKEEGARTVIVEAIKGREDEHANDLGSLRLAWIKDGVAYVFSKQTEWWMESVRKREAEEAPAIAIRYGGEERIPKEALQELQSKDENQFVEEILAFLSKEFPEASTVIGIPNFWQQKGIQRWALEPKLQFKIEKVEARVRQRLEQERLKKEKEQIEKERAILPKLIEECLEWAKKNQIRKVTKSNIDFFLTEKEIELTKTSRDALYNQVNFKLQRI